MPRPYDSSKGFTTIEDYEDHHYPFQKTKKEHDSQYRCLKCGGSVKIKGSSEMLIGDKLCTSYYTVCRVCGFAPIFYDDGSGRHYRPSKGLASGKVLRSWKQLYSNGHTKLAQALANAALKSEMELHEDSL